MHPDIPLTTVAALLARYDGLLLDAYGVLFHESGALPGAAELVQTLEARRMPWFVLTNDASKLPQTAAVRWAGFGVTVPAERILTAGGLLTPWFARHGLAGARCAVLGTADSARYVALAGGEVVPPAAPFDVLVIGDGAGYDFMPTADAVLSSLCRALDAERSVRLVVPNPDLIYPSRAGFGIASGAIAALFETALAARYPQAAAIRFERLGKPDAALFHAAAARAGGARLVMIGDQLATDIRGARGAGLDAAWIATGVGGPELHAMPRALWPDWRLASL